MTKSHLLGAEAERRALRYFLAKNYRLLEKNYRFQKAEVDLILLKEDVLVVVEVKARSTEVRIILEKQKALFRKRKFNSW